MNKLTLSRYRNLKHLSSDEWRSLDIHLFIAANFNRYCSPLLKKIGFQHLPSDASQCLLSLFCATAYKPLLSVHEKNLDAEGERRNQVMLGTLKMISMTRMVDAVINEFPAYIPLDCVSTQRALGEEPSEEFIYRNPSIRNEQPNAAAGISEKKPLHDTPFSEPSDDSELALLTPEEQEILCQKDEQNKSYMIETLRHHFTITQYQTIRHLLCDNMDIQQIAENTGTSLTNIRIMLQNIRRRMYDLIPPHQAQAFDDCLFRK